MAPGEPLYENEKGLVGHALVHVDFNSTDLNDGVDRSFTLKAGDRPIIIGRASKSAGQNLRAGKRNGWIESPVVSRAHAKLDIGNTEQKPLFLTDTNSTHGTFVNGTKLVPNIAYALQKGDTVKFGAAVTTSSSHFGPKVFKVVLDALGFPHGPRSSLTTSLDRTGPPRQSGYGVPQVSDSEDDLFVQMRQPSVEFVSSQRVSDPDVILVSESKSKGTVPRASSPCRLPRNSSPEYFVSSPVQVRSGGPGENRIYVSDQEDGSLEPVSATGAQKSIDLTTNVIEPSEQRQEPGSSQHEQASPAAPKLAKSAKSHDNLYEDTESDSDFEESESSDDDDDEDEVDEDVDVASVSSDSGASGASPDDFRGLFPPLSPLVDGYEQTPKAFSTTDQVAFPQIVDGTRAQTPGSAGLPHLKPAATAYNHPELAADDVMNPIAKPAPAWAADTEAAFANAFLPSSKLQVPRFQPRWPTAAFSTPAVSSVPQETISSSVQYTDGPFRASSSVSTPSRANEVRKSAPPPKAAASQEPSTNPPWRRSGRLPISELMNNSPSAPAIDNHRALSQSAVWDASSDIDDDSSDDDDDGFDPHAVDEPVRDKAVPRPLDSLLEAHSRVEKHLDNASKKINSDAIDGLKDFFNQVDTSMEIDQASTMAWASPDPAQAAEKRVEPAVQHLDQALSSHEDIPKLLGYDKAPASVSSCDDVRKLLQENKALAPLSNAQVLPAAVEDTTPDHVEQTIQAPQASSDEYEKFRKTMKELRAAKTLDIVSTHTSPQSAQVPNVAISNPSSTSPAPGPAAPRPITAQDVVSQVAAWEKQAIEVQQSNALKRGLADDDCAADIEQPTAKKPCLTPNSAVPSITQTDANLSASESLSDRNARRKAQTRVAQRKHREHIVRLERQKRAEELRQARRPLRTFLSGCAVGVVTFGAAAAAFLATVPESVVQEAAKNFV